MQHITTARPSSPMLFTATCTEAELMHSSQLGSHSGHIFIPADEARARGELFRKTAYSRAILRAVDD
jgi:hypothetical protein